MLAFLVRRVLQLVPVLIAIASLNFFLVHLAPGDAAEIIAGQSGHGTPEMIAALRRDFGLDQSLPQQFFIFIGRLLRFDLGMSAVQQVPVGDLIVNRLPATLLLMVSAIALAIVLGVLLGVAAARRRGKWLDHVIAVGALVFYAVPVFWLGLMLIVLFSIVLGVLPSGGMSEIGTAGTGWSHVLDVLRHLVLPAATMALFYLALYTRVMRTSMLEVLSLEYITAARAKGLPEGAIAWRHAVPNAILPVVTLAGIQFGHLLGGSILIETVFAWPGLGRLVFDALLQRDTNVLLGVLFVSSVVVVIANLLVDLLYGVLDPRIVHK
ncbi:MAG: ABC transporter permease [Casimicrobiaceae bacterium]